MTKVLVLNHYRKKETIQTLRELFVKASRGGIAGFAFCVEFTDGTHKAGVSGSFLNDPEDAHRHVDEIRDLAADKVRRLR